MSIQITRNTIYALKQRYGASLQMYHTVTSDVNLETGERTIDVRVYRIAKVILSPGMTTRDAVKLAQFSAVDDKERVEVIIDARDMPKGVTFNLNDYFICKNKRYNFLSVESYEGDDRILMITGTRTLGEQTAAIHTGVAGTEVSVTNGGRNES